MDKQKLNSKNENTEIKAMVEYEHITDTPFTLCRKEEDFCLLIGNTQVTDWGTKEYALKHTDIRKCNWNTITTIVCTMIENYSTWKELKEQANLTK